MDISKLVCSLFIVSALLVLSPQMAAGHNSKLYREYIGAMSDTVTFEDVPINPNVEFHFILAFAVDYTNSDSPSPTYGMFDVFWNKDNFSPDAVKDIKEQNENVKVALSLGGAEVRKEKVVFSAPSVDDWVKNAASSLTSIIKEYHLDGIDINYENFDKSSGSVATFVECIGRLIRNLTEDDVISFVSIAPFEDEPLKTYYEALWKKHRSLINYVNFQFYAYDSKTTKDEFLDYYKKQNKTYAGKLLAGFTTDIVKNENHGLLPVNGFFDACKDLKNDGELPGIFHWCADTSLNSGFTNETEAQQLLSEE